MPMSEEDTGAKVLLVIFVLGVMVMALVVDGLFQRVDKLERQVQTIQQQQKGPAR